MPNLENEVLKDRIKKAIAIIVFVLLGVLFYFLYAKASSGTLGIVFGFLAIGSAIGAFTIFVCLIFLLVVESIKRVEIQGYRIAVLTKTFSADVYVNDEFIKNIVFSGYSKSHSITLKDGKVLIISRLFYAYSISISEKDSAVVI